jgi:hypothetical protein
MSARSKLCAWLLTLVALAPMIGCAADSADEEEDVGATDSAITARSWKSSAVRYVALGGLPLQRGLVKVNGQVIREDALQFLVANGQAKLDVPPAVARCISTGDKPPAGCAYANWLQILFDLDLGEAPRVKSPDGVRRYDLSQRAWAPAGAECFISSLRGPPYYGVVHQPHLFGAKRNIGFECSDR